MQGRFAGIGSVTDLPEKSIRPGVPFAVRVTPRARQNSVTWEPGPPPGFRVRVTAVPEDGRANAAVTTLLAKALGVPKSRLELLRGATGRDKLFRLRP